MSKHLRALGKLKKTVLGLTTINLDTEITSLSERRNELPDLIYNATDEAIAGEVLSNMVDKYHLKEASLVEREEKDGSISLTFPTDTTKFITEINEELSAKCETQFVIESAKKKVDTFFSQKRRGVLEPIDSGIDGSTISSILNYTKFIENANNYVDSSGILYFIELVEKGNLKLDIQKTKPVATTHLNTLSYTYILASELGSKVKLEQSREVVGAIRNGLGNIVIIKSDKENVYNVFTNISATGTPVTTTTYDLNKETFSNFELVDEKGNKESFSLTFETNGAVKEPILMATERSFTEVEKLVSSYRDTFIKKYGEYLPDFAQQKYFLNLYLERLYSKYNPYEEDEEGEVYLEDMKNPILSEDEKLKSKFTNFTNDVIDTLIELYYSDMTKNVRIGNIERYRKNISIATLNLGTQNDNSKNILSTYGETNLIAKKDVLVSLNKENGEIDTKITTLKNEKTTITNVQIEREEQKEDLEEILGGVDTTFIDKIGLSKDSIISAKSAHTETLKIYTGYRINEIIKDSIAKGKFEVEVFELTDIEAKLLLDGGYFIKETTEPIKSGNQVIEKSTWTINWENANSVGEAKVGPIAEAPLLP